MTMIQYSRITGTFVPPDEIDSPTHLELCAKLNSELNEVCWWLDLKMRSGRCAHGFLAELSVKSAGRLIDVYAIYDEIGKLEGADIRPSMTKRPRQMRGVLRGLWHKHYFEPRFILRNLMNETEEMVKDGRWEEMFTPHYGKYVHEFIDQVSYQIVVGAYERRARDQRITGEFFVYERLPDGSNYYLTLGTHGEWDAIRHRVEPYKSFDAGDCSPL